MSFPYFSSVCVCLVCVCVCACWIGALRTKLYFNLLAFEPSLVDFVCLHVPCKGLYKQCGSCSSGFDEEQQAHLQADFVSFSVLWTPLPSLPHAKRMLYHGAVSPTQGPIFSTITRCPV